MKYSNSTAIIRTRKGNTVYSYLVFTHKYQKIKPKQYDYNYKGYCCDSFEVLENCGGDVIVETLQKLQHSGVSIKNTIRFRNVTKIEIFSEHGE